MNGIVIIAHAPLASALRQCVAHVFPEKVESVQVVDVLAQAPAEQSLAQAQQAAGETSRLDLVRAQIELADNTRAELEARVRATRALGALEDAVQRPIDWTDSVWRSNPRSAAQ